LSGAVIYNINLNGATYTTSESEFTLPLVNGYNTIVVTTDKLCQGTREKQIELSKDHQLYPNPVISGVNLNLGKEIIQDAVIKIYALDGRTVYSTMYTNISGVVQLDLSILKADWYILKLSIGNKETTFRIVKL
jgi:hypothetical protein